MTTPAPRARPTSSPAPSPVLAWIRRASTLTFALAVVAVVVVTLAVLVIVNPGHHVAPVQPASPAVGEAHP